MSTENLIEEAITAAGGQARVAVECGVKQPSVFKWAKNGHLPRTDFTGETNYAETISRLTNGKFSKQKLLSTYSPEPKRRRA